MLSQDLLIAWLFWRGLTTACILTMRLVGPERRGRLRVCEHNFLESMRTENDFEKPHGGWLGQGCISSSLWSSPSPRPCSSSLFEPLPIALSTSSYRGSASFLGGTGAPNPIGRCIPLVAAQISVFPVALTIHSGGIHGLTMHMHIVDRRPCAFTSNAFHQHEV